MRKMHAAEISPFTSAWSGNRQALEKSAHAMVKRHGGDSSSKQAAERLGERNTIAVVCGQQPALGGGPLYSLVKCADAIARAQQLCSNGQPAVPVFWCASDDHDAGEADHADLLQRDGSILRIRGQIAQRGAALHRQEALAHWPSLIEALQQLDGPRLGRDWLMDYAPKAGEGMGAWLCRLLMGLFSGQGLLCFEAKDLRSLMLPTAQRSLDQWPVAELAALREELLSAGKDAAFPPLLQAPWFADQATQRQALSLDQASAVMASEPLSLSAGAALRPILQQAALPAAIYCAGPGELAYHAFLQPLYGALGVSPPQLVARHKLGIIDSWCQRGLKHWACSPEDLAPQARLPQLPLSDQGTQALTIFSQSIAQLQELSTHSDSDTSKRLQGALRRLQQGQDNLKHSLSRGQRQRQQKIPAGALRNWLYPRNLPQERVMSSMQAIWHYGPGIYKGLIAAATTKTPWLAIDS